MCIDPVYSDAPPPRRQFYPLPGASQPARGPRPSQPARGPRPSQPLAQGPASHRPRAQPASQRATTKPASQRARAQPATGPRPRQPASQPKGHGLTSHVALAVQFPCSGWSLIGDRRGLNTSIAILLLEEEWKRNGFGSVHIVWRSGDTLALVVNRGTAI